uniref:Uncharacterized protein n=1 Tax=Zooxanthella nutricula TaxID=1333877 RepID=A0A7S2JDX3_9DINO
MRFPVLAAVAALLAPGARACLPRTFVSTFQNKTEEKRKLDALKAQLADPTLRIVPDAFVQVRLGDYEMGLLNKGRPVFGGNPDFSSDGKCLKKGMTEVLSASSGRLFVSYGMFFLCGSSTLKNEMEEFFQMLVITGKTPTRTMHTDTFYIAGPDSADGIFKFIRDARRPLVVIGQQHTRQISCRWFPTRVGWIPGISPEDSRECSASGADKFKAEILRHSRRFPGETVVFAMSSGTWGKIVTAKLVLEEPELQKDLFFDTGSSMDAPGGLSSRDYNRDWKKNCNAFASALTCSDCNNYCRSKALCAGCVSAEEVKDDCMASEPAAELPRAGRAAAPEALTLLKTPKSHTGKTSLRRREDAGRRAVAERLDNQHSIAAVRDAVLQPSVAEPQDDGNSAALRREVTPHTPMVGQASSSVVGQISAEHPSEGGAGERRASAKQAAAVGAISRQPLAVELPVVEDPAPWRLRPYFFCRWGLPTMFCDSRPQASVFVRLHSPRVALV